MTSAAVGQLATGVWERLAALRVLPVITVDDEDVAEPLADALLEAGLLGAEITFRTDAGEPVLRRMRQRTDLLLAAGTVLTPEQVDRAADAGADFIVSPGASAAVMDQAKKLSIPALPGVATPSEVQAVYVSGQEVMKVFPAGPLGGVEFLSMLAGPFPNARFVPSGGVTQRNAAHYLSHPSVLAVSSSWIAPRALLASRDFEAIRQLARATQASWASPLLSQDPA